MSDAKKCDRCGSYYELKYYNALEQAAQEISDVLDLTPGRAKVAKKILENVDLCSKCTESLKKWIKNTETEEAEKNG